MDYTKIRLVARLYSVEMPGAIRSGHHDRVEKDIKVGIGQNKNHLQLRPTHPHHLTKITETCKAYSSLASLSRKKSQRHDHSGPNQLEGFPVPKWHRCLAISRSGRVCHGTSGQVVREPCLQQRILAPCCPGWRQGCGRQAAHGVVNSTSQHVSGTLILWTP